MFTRKICAKVEKLVHLRCEAVFIPAISWEAVRYQELALNHDSNALLRCI